MLPRPRALSRIDEALRLHPVAALLGPRQCGKTTLARLIAARRPCEVFDLENPVDLQRLFAPMTALEKLSGLVIIDEVQRRTLSEVQAHPKLGASWEGFALEQVIRLLETRDAYFWATHGGATIDLLVIMGGKRYGFEIKYADAPSRSRSMLVATQDLKLEKLWVVYPGSKEYGLDKTISVVPLASIPRLADDLKRR